MLSISSNARLMLATIPVFNIVFLHNFKVEKRWSASKLSCNSSMQPCKSQDCTEHGTYTTQQNIILGVSGSGSVALGSHTASNKNKPKNKVHKIYQLLCSNANTKVGGNIAQQISADTMYKSWRQVLNTPHAV